MGRTIWIVGRWTADGWNFQGAFEREDLAVKACRDSSYFVAPAVLDVALPHEQTTWPGAYYPLAIPERP